MEIKKHGNPPYNVVTVHGGPGGAGEMTAPSREIAEYCSVIEAFQTALSVRGQIEELKDIILTHCSTPAILIGHSWGAWLSFILAAEYPELVKKLILVSSAVFDERYTAKMMETRFSHLNDLERKEIHSLMESMKNQEMKDHPDIFARFGALFSKADTYRRMTEDTVSDEVLFRPDIYQRVWPEAAELRSSGKLLQYGTKVKCPITVIHGDYDPSPYDGVKIPLSSVLKDCKFILLKNCGHTPWIEQEANKIFFSTIRNELSIS